MFSISSTFVRKCGLCISKRNGKLSLNCLVFVTSTSVIKHGPLFNSFSRGASIFLGFQSKLHSESHNSSLLVNQRNFSLDFDKARYRRRLEQNLFQPLPWFNCQYYCQSHHQTTNNGKVTDGESCEDSSSGIMKVLNVAEKNDAAKRIANLLANGVVQTVFD